MKTNNKNRNLSIAAILLISCLTITISAQNGPCANINDVNPVVPSTVLNAEENSAYTHYLKGVNFDLDEDLENALVELSKAIELDPRFAEAYDKRGMVYTKMIKYRKAMKDFDMAVSLNPNFAEAYNHRGIAQYCQKEFEAAIFDYNKAIQLEPSYAKAYFNRGIARLLANDEINGITDITKASEMNVDEARKFLAQNESNAFEE